MTVPLSVRVGDRLLTNVEDLSYSHDEHGPAAATFRVAGDIINTTFAAFADVFIFDTRSAQVVWDGQLEDPGRSWDADGQGWAMAAVGRKARLKDRTATLVYIDTDYSGWIDAVNVSGRVKSATAQAADIPDAGGREGLLFQFIPGAPVDNGSTSTMRYDRFRNTDDMDLGGFAYSVMDGSGSVNYVLQASTHGGGGGFTVAQQEAFTGAESPRRHKSAGGASAFPVGDQRLDIEIVKISGGATLIGGDNTWGAALDVRVSGLRLFKDGTVNAGVDAYAADHVFAHEVVEDLLGRLLPNLFDVPASSIDTTGTYQIIQLAYPDGVTAEKVLDDIDGFEPDHTWRVGCAHPFTGKPALHWLLRPTHIRYIASLAHGVDLPGAEAQRYNRVSVRWLDGMERSRTTVVEAGETTPLLGIVVPDVPELAAAGPGGSRLVREPEEPIDLADEVGSARNAERRAAEFLLTHATPPVSGSLTVAGRVYDTDLGRWIDPHEMRAGGLLLVPELATTAAELAATGPNGTSVFRVAGTNYTADVNTAQVELDAPPRDDETLLASVLSARERKR